MPKELRSRLGWTDKHDRAAFKVIEAFGFRLPRDWEMVRKLAFMRVAQKGGPEVPQRGNPI